MAKKEDEQPNPNPNPNPDPVDDETPPAEETVSRKEFDRVKADMHKYKDAWRNEQSKIKSLEEERLRKAQEFETLYENEKKEKENLLTENTNMKQAVVRSARLNAAIVAAKKIGIRDEALDDLKNADLSGIRVESIEGEITTSGADEVLARIKPKKPHWFSTKPSNLNPGSPRSEDETSSKITIKQLNEAQKNAEKTGDYTEYKKMHSDFRKQQQQKK